MTGRRASLFDLAWDLSTAAGNAAARHEYSGEARPPNVLNYRTLMQMGNKQNKVKAYQPGSGRVRLVVQAFFVLLGDLPSKSFITVCIHVGPTVRNGRQAKIHGLAVRLHAEARGSHCPAYERPEGCSLRDVGAVAGQKQYDERSRLFYCGPPSSET